MIRFPNVKYQRTMVSTIGFLGSAGFRASTVWMVSRNPCVSHHRIQKPWNDVRFPTANKNKKRFHSHGFKVVRNGFRPSTVWATWWGVSAHVFRASFIPTAFRPSTACSCLFAFQNQAGERYDPSPWACSFGDSRAHEFCPPTLKTKKKQGEQGVPSKTCLYANIGRYIYIYI